MILASASPRRRELVEGVGLVPTVMPSTIDETPQEGEDPEHLVRRQAEGKLEVALPHLLAQPQERTALAADTIVWTPDGQVLGKPQGPEDAAGMLRALSGCTHHVSTGVACAALVEGELRTTSFVERTAVTFHELTDAQIAAYVATGEPLDKAGAYGIQGEGRLLVSRIEGDYFNVVGLPVSRTVRELGQLLGEKDLVASVIQRSVR